MRHLRCGCCAPRSAAVCVVVCLAFAGWAVWSAGLLDGPIAQEVRTSSVYAAPALDLDEDAAERIIGNRRLVVVLLEPGADLPAACKGLRRAAAGTLVVVLSPTDDGYDRYSCSYLGSDLGRSMVIETVVPRGISEFADQPLEALKVIGAQLRPAGEGRHDPRRRPDGQPVPAPLPDRRRRGAHGGGRVDGARTWAPAGPAGSPLATSPAGSRSPTTAAS